MSENERITLRHEGETYFWTERTGFVDESWQRPPRNVELHLEKQLDAALRDSDTAIIDLAEMVKAASRSRELGNLGRAERLSRQALERHPKSDTAAAILSAVLRARGKSEEALKATEPFVKTSNVALLTTRAAALLDVGEPQEARRLLDRAWAISRSRGEFPGETSLVYKRLESEFEGSS